MDSGHKEFRQRISRINKGHRRLVRGAAPALTQDGLLVYVPQRRRTEFPWRGLLVIAVAAVFIKAFILAHVGQASFESRIGKLAGGTMVEQVGAFLMAPDPVTMMLAGEIRPLLSR